MNLGDRTLVERALDKTLDLVIEVAITVAKWRRGVREVVYAYREDRREMDGR